ncbi:hypothetical protein J4772_13535 [Cohnella sp. LGH]|uniref:hypothetical protein n=1 Tax=Cohnella sp. LGH TaxID=1619153 RepID=UPI001ADC1B8B|nr:hypothetical protein [Cohnella sp. LGH]QTH45334.1 hypothetical protein J4772_13535 [Cohnella sp. LGH]
MEQRHILIAAPNEAGKRFIKLLRIHRIPVAVLTNNGREERELRGLGVDCILRVDTVSIKENSVPSFPIGRVFIFESSLPLSCQYLLLLANWSCKAITVVTGASHPEVIYRKLGASYIVHTQANDVGFLLGSWTD